MNQTVTTGRPCDVCGQDIFPRCVTREMGARCVEHAFGRRELVATIRRERDDIATAFRMGWHDGQLGIGPTTMRQALEAYGRPIGQQGLGWGDELCSVYLNGREDGVRGDTFRFGA